MQIIKKKSSLSSITKYILRQSAIVLFAVIAMTFHSHLFAKPADVNRHDVTTRMNEIMECHAMYKKMTPEIAKRSLVNFINILDPTKTYFIESEIHEWLEPSDKMLEEVVKDYEYSKFLQYEKIMQVMRNAINRRDALEDQIDKEALPTGVTNQEFKDLKWCTNEGELLTRLKRIRSLQMESAAKLDKDVNANIMERIKKRRLNYEQELMTNDTKLKDKLLCTDIMKSIASALDGHTFYFTPSEANQFLIDVQQRLLGIGVQLRNDIDGFTIMKIVEGGPAEKQGTLKVKDKIIAVNHEPVVGMDSQDAVDLMRGPDGTEVVLTILRPIADADSKQFEKKNITIKRGEVVIKEARVESGFEPYGDGVIAYLDLHSFYQDEGTSSAQDLTRAFDAIAKSHKIEGVILDLRFNTGGMLVQAVEVAGLFMKKGIVVSIKDENGQVQHLRCLNSKVMWDGPLLVLVNRLSASAAEIVSQTLQDYGRAIVVGDDHTFGKGSFQTFTLAPTTGASIDPKGEYKVTRGRYYTVSGKTPQVVGVQSDIVVPGGLSFMEIGEQYATYPLANDSIPSNFEDTFADVPFFQRERVKRLYGADSQKKLDTFQKSLPQLKVNSNLRIENNKGYQKFLQKIKNIEAVSDDSESFENMPDFQLQEAYNIIKDYLWFQEHETKMQDDSLHETHKAA